jgi:HEPN domain-containing protein
MSPAEDALLLLAIVRRHLRSLGLSLDPAYPDEDWGFTAQQAVEKLLKAWIVLADRRPPRVHDLEDLVALAGQQLDHLLLALVQAELERCERMVAALGESAV